MVNRQVNWKKHLLTLCITLIIFIVGILIGVELSDKRIAYTEDIATQQRLEYESLQLQLLYLSENKENCELLFSTLDRNLHDLEQQRLRLEQYISSSNDEDYDLIKKEYLLTEIRYWMLAKDAKTFCEADFVPILFFYLRNEDCELCSTQGHILTYTKDKLKQKVLIFSLDAASEDPMVNLLKNSFNVTSSPSIIINTELYEGLTKKEELLEKICSNLASTPSYCNEFL